MVSDSYLSRVSRQLPIRLKRRTRSGKRNSRGVLMLIMVFRRTSRRNRNLRGVSLVMCIVLTLRATSPTLETRRPDSYKDTIRGKQADPPAYPSPLSPEIASAFLGTLLIFLFSSSDPPQDVIVRFQCGLTIRIIFSFADGLSNV